MARDREIVCKFYEYEGKCSKGREGTFRGSCQHCTKYRKKEGAKPARIDNRQQKRKKIAEREMRW